MEFGIVQRDAVAAAVRPLFGAEPLDVRLRQAGQLLPRQEQGVVNIIDVVAELDAEDDQALLQRLDASASLRRQVHPAAAKVAE